MTDNTKTVRILALDGGGVRSLFTACMLEALEARIAEFDGPRLNETFDMIVGTSTGGILAAGLAKPQPLRPKELVKFFSNEFLRAYKKDGLASFQERVEHLVTAINNLNEKKSIEDMGVTKLIDIFLSAFDHNSSGTVKQSFHAGNLIGLFSIPRHDQSIMQKELDELLKHHTLSDVKGCDLMLLAYRLGIKVNDATSAPTKDQKKYEGPYYFKNWDVKDAQIDKPDSRLSHAAYASSATPILFKPAILPKNNPGDLKEIPFVLADGGLYANNPAMCAYVEARKRYPDAKIMIVSIGSGKISKDINRNPLKNLILNEQQMGVASWNLHLLNVLSSGVGDAVNYQLQNIIPGDFYRLDASLDDMPAGYDSPFVSMYNDNSSEENIKALKVLAKKAIEDNSAMLTQIAARVSTQREAFTFR